MQSEAEYGIEGRRAQFQKDSYRQPVLTRRPMNPKNYRRGKPDPEAELCRTQLRELRSHNCTSKRSGTTGILHNNQETIELEKKSNQAPYIV